jgi:anti-sigma factor RsiW
MTDALNGERDDVELRALLPWYLKGTLDAAARARVEAFLERSPEARAEAAWLARLDADLRAATPLPERAPGFDRFMERLAAHRAPNVVAFQRKEKPRWLAPAFALAATLVVAQAGVIGVLMQQRDATLTTLSAPPAADAGARLQVTFRPEATEAQIRALLAEAGAQIVAGPGALGVYTLSVAPEKLDAARERLAARNDVVESVRPVEP